MSADVVGYSRPMGEDEATFPTKRPGGLAPWLDGLRKAGLPAPCTAPIYNPARTRASQASIRARFTPKSRLP